jgi:starch-binding outer membrane protein, SusD/RagB family
MKNINKILILCASALFMFSCDDATDVVQDGELYKESAFTKVSHLRNYVDGDVYNRLNITNEIAFTSIFTDELGIGPDSGGQNLELHRFQFNASSGEASNLWLTHYTLINRVNRLLEYANLVTATTATDIAQKNSILAEGRALRAFAYMQLLAYYSTDYANPNALGVILSTDVEDPLLVRERLRVSNQLIYDQIEADLLFAQNNLAATATNYRFVTRNFVSATRARHFLYRKDYVNAKLYATQALTAVPLATSTATYWNMWNQDSAQGEIIAAASRPSGGTWGNIASTWYFNVTTATGGCFHDMGRNLFNLYNTFPGDVRRVNWIDATAVLNPNYLSDINYVENDIIPINKYPGKPSQQLRNDLKIFRASEMALIIAECEVGQAVPNLVAAATRVRSVRTARGTGQPLPVYATAQAAWADILAERRKELAFEGHRYLDIKRLATLAGVPGIDRNNTDDSILGQPLTLPVTDYRFTFPIPQLEVAGNVMIQQNPGY